jgi:hypothetical protein
MTGTGFEDEYERATPQGCAIIILGFFMLFAFVSWAGHALREEVVTSPTTWDTVDTGTEAP